MTKKVASFGKGGEPIPNRVERFNESLGATVEEETFTP